MKRRVFSALLSLCLTLTLTPMNAWASELDDGEHPPDLEENAKSLSEPAPEPEPDSVPDLNNGPVTMAESDETEEPADPAPSGTETPPAADDSSAVLMSDDVVGSGTWQNGYGEDNSWTLYDDGRLVLSGQGDMPYYYNESIDSRTPWYNNRRSITAIIVGEGITSISQTAFLDCSNVTDVDLPSTLNLIDYNAFSKCSSLVRIQIPDGVKRIESGTFSDCSALPAITIPNGVEEIGYNAFQNCSSLLSIVVPESVRKIGSYAFSGCSKLSDVSILGSTTEIDSGVFWGCTSLK